jgi:hypothetical protein
MAKLKLTDEDWSFFETVARAAFSNPFGRTRDDLDLRIGGASPDSSAEEILGAVLARVENRIAGLKKAGKADLGLYEGNLRDVLRAVLLFQVFHRHMEDFDKHIHAQEKKGDTPIPVAFARDVLGELHAFGFSEPEALRFLAVFYQLRRAYYFIRGGLVGSSESMRTLRKHLWDCVFTHDIRWFESRLWNRMEDFAILLLGETGTGKGAAAAAIGKSGFIPFDPARNCFAESFTRNFVAINLSQYSEGVIESELFGHKKGAFTGAVEEHEGLFARCAPHGVIFIDEIGDISVPIQIKLLQVLQERIFFPVGSHAPRRFSGRVVAATNRPLGELRRAGTFRDDLYYRLSSDVVSLPALRERLREDPAELELLLKNILTRIAGQVPERERDVLKKILLRDVGRDYAWPGNVRELEQAVKRILITGRYQVERPGASGVGREEDLRVRMGEGAIAAEELLAGYCALLYERFGTFEEVARRTRLDRRTARKYALLGKG